MECPKQRPAGKKQEKQAIPLKQNLSSANSLDPLMSRSVRSGKVYVRISTNPICSPILTPPRMSYTVLSRSFRRQQVHIIANFRTISTTATPAAAMSKIIIGPSEIKGERIKGAHWKNNNGTAFKNPWSSFNMPVSMFLAHLITHCLHTVGCLEFSQGTHCSYGEPG